MLPFNCVKVLLIGLNGLNFTFGGSGHGVQFPHGTTAVGGGGRYSLHQANENIATTTEIKMQSIKAFGLNTVAPILEVGHNAPQRGHRRTLFTSVLQRVQISLAKTIPRLAPPSTSYY